MVLSSFHIENTCIEVAYTVSRDSMFDFKTLPVGLVALYKTSSLLHAD